MAIFNTLQRGPLLNGSPIYQRYIPGVTSTAPTITAGVPNQPVVPTPPVQVSVPNQPVAPIAPVQAVSAPDFPISPLSGNPIQTSIFQPTQTPDGILQNNNAVGSTWLTPIAPADNSWVIWLLIVAVIIALVLT